MEAGSLLCHVGDQDIPATLPWLRKPVFGRLWKLIRSLFFTDTTYGSRITDSTGVRGSYRSTFLPLPSVTSQAHLEITTRGWP